MKKIGEIIKNNLVAIVGVAIIGAFNWFGDTVSKGHDATKHEQFIVELKTKDAVHIIDSIFESKAHEKTTDFEMFDKILSSPFVGDYVKQTSEEFEKKIIADYDRRDSMRGDWLEQVGAGTDSRNENVIPDLIDMLNDYKAGKFYSSRTVRGEF